MNKRIGVFVWLLCSVNLLLQATVPTGYYNSAEGLKAAALKTGLHNIICQDTTHYLNYGSGKGSTWEGFYYTDRDKITNAVIDMYSDSVRYFPNPNPDFTAFGQLIHIEHSVPKSWWGCDITHPDCPAKDLHHLFPADGSANTSKNDNPLGIVTGTPTFNNGVVKIGPGVYDGYVGPVFEPADQYKGDFARAYLYMATAYEHYVNKWDLSKPENMMQKNRYPVLKPWALQLLLQWHRQDPVSVKEIFRNDIIYGLQKNRNPFIDYPVLVEYIWGNKTTIPFRLDGSIYFPYLKWPSTNDTLNLGKVYCQYYKDTVLNLQGMNITGDLTLALGGANASCFSLDRTTITSSEALTGTTVGIHCNANVVGPVTALLSISGGGITSVIMVLKASASNDFAALQPHTTSSVGFLAEWMASPGATGYSLNVFTLQKSGATTDVTTLEEDFPLSIPPSWTREAYAEFVSGTVRLASGNSYGKLISPEINLTAATSTLLVRAKQYGSDAGAKLTATLDGNQVAVWSNVVANTDFTVELPIASAVSKVALSAIPGKRVYVDYVKITSHQPVFTPISVSAYPKQLGNVLSYNVTGLQSGTKYYYTVTPLGNNAPVSNQVAVETTISTSIQEQTAPSFKWSKTPDGICLDQLSAGTRMTLTTLDGRVCWTQLSTGNQMLVPLKCHGVYVLTLQYKSSLQQAKVIY